VKSDKRFIISTLHLHVYPYIYIHKDRRVHECKLHAVSIYTYAIIQCPSHCKIYQSPETSLWITPDTLVSSPETSLWITPDTPVSSANRSDRNKITESLLKLALNTQKISHFLVL
jgi:hypothetical protein